LRLRRIISRGEWLGIIACLWAGCRRRLFRWAWRPRGVGSSLRNCSRMHSQPTREFGQSRIIRCGDRCGRSASRRARRRRSLFCWARRQCWIGSSPHLCSRKHSQPTRKLRQRRMIGRGDRCRGVSSCRGGRARSLFHCAQWQRRLESSRQILARWRRRSGLRLSKVRFCQLWPCSREAGRSRRFLARLELLR
jgi:hypothetical protein